MVKNAKWTKLRIGQNEKLGEKNRKLDKMENWIKMENGI